MPEFTLSGIAQHVGKELGVSSWVTVDQSRINQFAECSGLSLEYDMFEYQEGGQLGFVHKFRGALKYPNLVLKRGVTYEDALLTWFLDRTSARAAREQRARH